MVVKTWQLKHGSENINPQPLDITPLNPPPHPWQNPNYTSIVSSEFFTEVQLVI